MTTNLYMPSRHAQMAVNQLTLHHIAEYFNFNIAHTHTEKKKTNNLRFSSARTTKHKGPSICIHHGLHYWV
jgi:hypothetical protein